MSRNINREIIVTDDDLYDELFEKRGLKSIEHYTTVVMNHPTRFDRSRLQRLAHIWKTSDTMMNLANKHYGDVRLWWIIAWYNTAPTDAHFRLGQTIYIPHPLREVMTILRSD